MPRNAANKDVIQLAAGVTRRFRSRYNRGVQATGNVFNPSHDTNLTFKFQHAAFGRNETQQIVFAGTTLTGTFTLSLLGKTSIPVTWSSTGSTLKANLDAALADLTAKIGVTGTATRTTQGSVGANAGTLTIQFVGALANQDIPTIVVNGVGTSLTGGSPTAVVTVTAAGTTGPGTYSDAVPDGQAAATFTVPPRASKPFSFGTASGSASNILNQFVNIVGISGIGELEINWDETHMDSLVI